MDNSDQEPVRPTRERLHVDLRRLDWATELNEETLTAVTNKAEWVQFKSGEVVIEVESRIVHVCFLITGRMQATLHDLLGKEIQKDTFGRGSVIGLFSLGLSEPSQLQVLATEPSTAIRLALPDLLQLTATYPDFQLSMFRLEANIFKRYVTVDRSLPKPSVVGIVHHTPATRPITARLARRLQDLGETPCIAGDDQRWKPDGDIPFRLLDADTHEARQEILKDWAANRRLLV